MSFCFCFCLHFYSLLRFCYFVLSILLLLLYFFSCSLSFFLVVILLLSLYVPSFWSFSVLVLFFSNCFFYSSNSFSSPYPRHLLSFSSCTYLAFIYSPFSFLFPSYFPFFSSSCSILKSLSSIPYASFQSSRFRFCPNTFQLPSFILPSCLHTYLLPYFKRSRTHTDTHSLFALYPFLFTCYIAAPLASLSCTCWGALYSPYYLH